MCAGTIRHGRARRAGAPFTRWKGATKAMPDTTPASKLRSRRCRVACTNVRAPFRTILKGGKTAGTVLSVPQHMAWPGPSSPGTAVLHSVGARRPGRTCREQAECPLRRASEGAGCLIWNRHGSCADSCEPRVVKFPHGVHSCPSLVQTCATVARARRRVPRWSGAALELQHEPPSLTRSSRSALLSGATLFRRPSPPLARRP